LISVNNALPKPVRGAQLDPFKDHLIEEEEGLSFIGPIVGAHWFALGTGVNRDIGVAFSPKDTPF